jgi:hypothetical protein
MDDHSGSFNFGKGPTGRELRDRGIARAVARTAVIAPEWRDAARAAATKIIGEWPVGHEFRTETVREEAEKRGCGKPSTPRAWASIALWLAHVGVSEKVRVEPCVNPRAHMSYVTVWRKR